MNFWTSYSLLRDHTTGSEGLSCDGMPTQVSRDSSRGKIVVLLGFDGCGKTTLLSRLRQYGHSTSSWEDLRDVAALQYQGDNLLNPGRYRPGLLPRTRGGFVLTAVFAEYEFIVEPITKTGRHVIVDSYYHRPVAKELVKGATPEPILASAALLPRPDLIIVLRVTPEAAFSRKGQISEYETMWQPSFSEFREFQERVLDTALAIDPMVPVTWVDAERDPQYTYDQVSDELAVFV